jgi:hypothetical protein
MDDLLLPIRRRDAGRFPAWAAIVAVGALARVAVLHGGAFVRQDQPEPEGMPALTEAAEPAVTRAPFFEVPGGAFVPARSRFPGREWGGLGVDGASAG